MSPATQRIITRFRDGYTQPGSSVLDVGSRQFGRVRVSDIMMDRTYVGIDRDYGPGVDLVVRSSEDWKRLHHSFDAAMCCNVLEHCECPAELLKNIFSSLKPGGVILVMVPWVFPYHEYPGDYWRFSPTGLKLLFSALGGFDHIQSGFITETLFGRFNTPITIAFTLWIQLWHGVRCTHSYFIGKSSNNAPNK